jgi:hypothetical protein
VRAGTPLTDVADMLGHSLQTLIATYAHAIRPLRGQTPLPVDEQVHAARADLARRRAAAGR